MKQILIAGNVAYPTDAANYMALAKGAIGVFKNDGTLLKTAAKASEDFISIVLGRGATIQPLAINYVDIKTLSVVKANYIAGTKFKASFIMPTPIADKDYTVIVCKKGVVFNERNTYTSTEKAKDGDTAETLMNRLVKQINAKSSTCNITASVDTTKLVINGINIGEDFSVVLADALQNVSFDSHVAGIPAHGDDKHIKRLAQEAAGGKGFEYLAEDGKEIYPGFPEVIAATQYVIYTLTFSNGSKVSTRQDDVRQIVNIAVPVGSAQITTLDTVFGTV